MMKLSLGTPLSIASILYLMALGLRVNYSQSDEKSYCYLWAADHSYARSSTCRLFGSNPDWREIRLEECKQTNNTQPIEGTKSCAERLSFRDKICKIDIEFIQLAKHASFDPSFKCEAGRDKATQQITLRSVTIEPSNIMLFENSIGGSNADLTTLKLDNLRASSRSLREFLTYNLRGMPLKKLIVSRAQILPTLDSYTFTGNESRIIELVDSKLEGIVERTFDMGKKWTLTEIVLRNLDLSGKKISNRAIYSYSCPQTDQGLSVRINHCGVTSSNLVSNFIFIGPDLPPTGCLTPLKLDLTDNEFGGLVPLETGINKLYEQWRNLTLKLDPIICCDKDNAWIFDMAEARIRSIQAECSDLGAPVSSYKDKSELDDTCSRRNVYPIALIAIVTVFLLASLIGMFSCVCIFYVLPRKRMAAAKSLAAAAKNAPAPTLRSSSTGSSHLTPLEEARSTQTALTEGGQPELMEQSQTRKLADSHPDTIRSLLPSVRASKATQQGSGQKKPSPGHDSSPKPAPHGSSPKPSHVVGPSPAASPHHNGPKVAHHKSDPKSHPYGSKGLHGSAGPPRPPHHGSGPKAPHHSSSPKSNLYASGSKPPQNGSSPKSPRPGSSPKSPKQGSSPKLLQNGSSPKSPKLGSSPKSPRPGSSPKLPQNGSSPKSPKHGSSPKSPRHGSDPRSPRNG